MRAQTLPLIPNGAPCLHSEDGILHLALAQVNGNYWINVYPTKSLTLSERVSCRGEYSMPLYRITIRSRTNSPGLPGKPPSKLEMLKAVLLGLLGLAIVIGIFLAAFVVGSIIASLLLILLGLVFVVWRVRYLLRKLKRPLGLS